jgi:hypothetical protein
VDGLALYHPSRVFASFGNGAKIKTMTANDYQPRTLVPLEDPWEAQSIITVADYFEPTRYFRVVAGESTMIDGPPAGGKAYAKPATGTDGHRLIERIENIVSAAVNKSSRAKLSLAEILKALKKAKISKNSSIGPLRLLVGRGTLKATRTGSGTGEIVISLSSDAKVQEARRSYASSFANELEARSKQIGDLIGHGPTIGGEREELLRSLLERHLPTRFHVATGFIDPFPNQMDILIYDQIDYAPLFRAGNLVVVPPEAVRAIIEVKSSLKRVELSAALQQIDIFIRTRSDYPPVFRGVFGYNGATAKTLVEAIAHHHREIGDDDDDPSAEDFPSPVGSIHEMVTAVCVLKKAMVVTGFGASVGGSATRFAPRVMELKSEAGRHSQGSIFFDLLTRFLRYPAEGSIKEVGLGHLIWGDTVRGRSTLLYGGRKWGPYLIDDGVEALEKDILNHDQWLLGSSWQPSKTP